MSAALEVKKVILVSITSTLVNMANIEADSIISLRLESPTPDNSAYLLNYVLYIYHPMQFKKNQAEVQTLLDSGSKVNPMTPTYMAKLGLKIQLINVGA